MDKKIYKRYRCKGVINDLDKMEIKTRADFDIGIIKDPDGFMTLSLSIPEKGLQYVFPCKEIFEDKDIR